MEKIKKKDKETPIMHGFDEGKTSLFSKKIIGLLLLVALLGVGTGFLLASSGGGGKTGVVGKLVNKSSVPAGKIYGIQDEKEFDMKEIPEGILKEGGIEGEGQFHLEREGGAARNVYLTSSNVDLSQFIDRKVKVWGHTQKAEKAGWLMDAGRVEVLE